MATTYDDANGSFPYRLRQVEHTAEELAAWRRTVDTSMARRDVQYKQTDEKVEALTRTVESLRRTILGFALSIAGSAVVFALSVLIATGKI